MAAKKEKKSKKPALFVVIGPQRKVILNNLGDPIELDKGLADSLASAIEGSSIPSTDIKREHFPEEISETSTMGMLREWVNLTSGIVQLFGVSPLVKELVTLRQRSKTVTSRARRQIRLAVQDAEEAKVG